VRNLLFNLIIIIKKILVGVAGNILHNPFDLTKNATRGVTLGVAGNILHNPFDLTKNATRGVTSWVKGGYSSIQHVLPVASPLPSGYVELRLILK
jgi:hypothetical protein